MACCCTKTACAVTSLIIGAILLIIGGIAITVYGALFTSILTETMTIADGSYFYDYLWVKVDTPTYLTYYFYNVTNAEEFLNQKTKDSVKLNVEEVGPYVYREYLEKDHIKFTNDGKVDFRQTTQIYFEEDLSVGSDKDLFTTANVVVGSLIPILEFATGNELSRPLLNAINSALESNKASLLSTRSVNDLLYGSQDPVDEHLIKLAESIDPRANRANILDSFGLFMNTNKSAGWYNYQVYTGADDIKQSNIITKYKNESELSYWFGPQCNMINGTDGTSTPPFMEKEDRVYFFVDDVCRSLYGIYEKDVEVRGVTGWKITTPGEIFEAPLYNKNNECFCHDFDSILCQHDGGISLRTCQFGAPVVISSPHYLFGDGFFLDMITGMSPPEKEKHEAALIYEPNTGIAIKADKRLQINLLIEPKSTVSIYDPVGEPLLIPILWVNENGQVGEEDAEMLVSLLYEIEDVVGILQIVLCVVGGILMVASGFYLTCGKKMNGKLDEENEKSHKSDKFGNVNESFSSASSSNLYEEMDHKKPKQKQTKI